MALTGVGFRWLDILEKEFDKACVELDTNLMELESEEPDLAYTARQKIATLGSCFAQLTHKALSIFQHSAKLEAELVDMRAELIQARAAATAGGGGAECVSPLEAIKSGVEAAQLARENAALRETVLALHSELFGARLATKYLDKELAGRIQQLQLLGRDMRAELRDSLWAQVEAEILLQRHKTLVRVCRGLAGGGGSGGAGGGAGDGGVTRPPAHARTVRVRRSHHLGLGISITGGREHGVPILISEVEAGGPAALTGQLHVGDAILAIDSHDLTQACHKEAVRVLQSVQGDCELRVQYIATDDDDRLSEDHYRFPLYPDEEEAYCAARDGSGATPTAPRTPDFHRRGSEASQGSCSASETGYDDACRPSLSHSYTQYNATHLNNNHSILDMDEHSIKVETEIASVEASPVAARAGGAAWWLGGGSRGRYRAVQPPPLPPPPAPARSTSESGSTPVHRAARRHRPHDWRAKGLYKSLDHEVHSTDEIAPKSPVNGFADVIPTQTQDRSPETENSNPSSELSPAEPPAGQPEPRAHDAQPTTLEEDASPPDDTKPPLNVSLSIMPNPTEAQLRAREGTHSEAPIFCVPAISSSDVALTSLKAVPTQKHNGLESKYKDKAFKNRPFKIGLAKRVSEPAAPTNGEVSARCHLLTGEGDPDFGTPV